MTDGLRCGARWGRSIPPALPGPATRPRRRHFPINKCTDHPAERGAHRVLSLTQSHLLSFKEMAPPYETKMDPFQAQPGDSRVGSQRSARRAISPRTEPRLRLIPLMCVRRQRLSIELPETKTEPECGARVSLI